MLITQLRRAFIGQEACGSSSFLFRSLFAQNSLAKVLFPLSKLLRRLQASSQVHKNPRNVVHENSFLLVTRPGIVMKLVCALSVDISSWLLQSSRRLKSAFRSYRCNYLAYLFKGETIYSGSSSYQPAGHTRKN